MGESNVLNSKTVKKFVKSTFVIIGLFVVLSYGLAAVVLLCSNRSNVTISGKDIRGSSIAICGSNITVSIKDSKGVTVSNQDSSSITISGKDSKNNLFENKLFIIVLLSVLIGVPSLIILVSLCFMIVLLVKENFTKSKQNSDTGTSGSNKNKVCSSVRTWDLYR